MNTEVGMYIVYNSIIYNTVKTIDERTSTKWERVVNRGTTDFESRWTT